MLNGRENADKAIYCTGVLQTARPTREIDTLPRVDGFLNGTCDLENFKLPRTQTWIERVSVTFNND